MTRISHWGEMIGLGYMVATVGLPGLWAFALAFALKRVDERRPPSMPRDWLEPDYSI
jgi:hypothetical protein